MSAATAPIRPIFAALAGIALFSGMDAAMKIAALGIGAYSAFLLRCILGTALIGPVWWRRGGRWPQPSVMRIHILRGVVVAFMGWSFFFALIRLPLAEAIAISFIAPLIALGLAAILLGERIEPRAIVAALLGLAGVVVIIGGKIGRETMSDEAQWGVAAILVSACLYAYNLVLQRRLALVASPEEISTIQHGIIALVLLPAAPFLLQWPEPSLWLPIGAAAVLAVGALLCLSWAYARAEAQVLVPIEYSGFLWAALLGWLFFDEALTPSLLVGALMIVCGCWIATRKKRPEMTAL
ncbi:DMT family transporter [Qipengyuania marisflavi]|uniref:DMT family transporter n=1 Tax=Qipengyuania marisflavi TaxID=2486356 RepID=UPI001FE4B7B6|nr:DMT family transporter [Qipengyuania marisflavi]